MLIFSKSSVSVAYPGEVKGYIGKGEYVKIKDSNKYYVYASSGEQVGKASYKYVELYDGFYAGVDSNNKMMLYNYDGEALLDASIELFSSNYCNTANPSFKVTYKDGKYKVSVYKSNKYETKEYSEISVEGDMSDEPTDDSEKEITE